MHLAVGGYYAYTQVVEGMKLVEPYILRIHPIAQLGKYIVVYQLQLRVYLSGLELLLAVILKSHKCS